MPGVPTAFDPREVERLQHQLRRSASMHLEYERLVRQPIDPMSTVALDLRDRLMIHVYDSSWNSLSAAFDHLHAAKILVDGRSVPSFTMMSLARVALETALYGYWVIEPLDADTRRARGFALAWANLVQLERVERLMDSAIAIERMSELLEQAESLGLTTLGREEQKHLTVVAPSAVDLCGRYVGDGEWMYRYLSGYSHGKLWALAVGLDVPAATDLGHGTAFTTSSAPDHHIVAGIKIAVDACGLALKRMGELRDSA